MHFETVLNLEKKKFMPSVCVLIVAICNSLISYPRENITLQMLYYSMQKKQQQQKKVQVCNLELTYGLISCWF